ncbi:hypothetical protein BDN70DRAFT_994783 [Pholiota conissans]|uniref:BTB domain-containing protein n=1 Tax=Pholiota conissans TaxID=109636 RepID=A0A9P5YXS5_9AGAR|nr:hypothetical protein BDN70DRAFT_994783 [Pholiota conissans]
MAQAQLPPPSLQEATKNSTVAWQEHLESLFHHAKDRFPDVVWELVGEDDDDRHVYDEVWGHKAIVYARAPPSFQNRYFAVRSADSTTALSYNDDDDADPAQSALSLGLDVALVGRTPSPSNAPHQTSSLLRITTSINPALFSNELEYLYTGKGFGEAFEFLFDSNDAREHAFTSGVDADDAEAMRIDKLRKDLVFMWRSRLYSDVRIALTGNFGPSSGANHESTTAIFSSHRFILVSRCTYFYNALVAWPTARAAPGEPPTLTLPSPPFTPASVHFTLGFLYTGTLIFSHRSYDLATAFAILRSAMYLDLDTLHDEIQARVAQEMMHGLFHAFLPFTEYEALTQGRWGTGGCRCRQCARRAPRILSFAVADDVHNTLLERGARRALVGLFGEGWVTQEFSALPQKLRESLMKGVHKRTTPENALPLLFAAQHALHKLGASIEPWADIVREDLGIGLNRIDEIMAHEAEAVFATEEWCAIVEGDGVRFEDGERVEWAMQSVLRGVKEAWAPTLYQTLVSAILLRPHPTEANAPLLSATSHIRVQVEQTRLELLKWIGKRWLSVRQERGFDALEGWSLKEISDHIEVPIDDLLSPPSYSSPQRRTPTHLRPASAHPHTSKADAASETGGSMRASVLSRVAGSTSGSRPSAGGAASAHTARTGARSPRAGAPSVHSLASRDSTLSSRSSIASTATASTMTLSRRPAPAAGATPRMSPARRIAAEVRMKERPDSKLTPEEGIHGDEEDKEEEERRKTPRVVEPEEEEEEYAEDEGRSELGVDEEQRVDATTPEPSERGDVGDEQDKVASQTSPAPLKKTLITRASLTSLKSSASKTGATATTTPVKRTPSKPVQDKGKAKEATPSLRSRTTSATSTTASLSPSVRARAPTSRSTTVKSPGPGPRPSSRASTTSTLAGRSRLTVGTPKNPSSTAAATATSPRIPRTPRTPSRPTSRISTRSISGGGARPASSVSATTDSYRTASSGGTATGTGTRSRRTSAASTLSTLSKHTATTTTTTTTGTGRGSPLEERRRRVSATSVNSVASARSAAGRAARTTSGPTPVRKTGEKLLSPAAAIAAAAKSRPGSVKASASGGSTSSGGSQGKVIVKKPVTVVDAPKVDEPMPPPESKMDEEEEGDTTIRMPLSDEADKENKTPAAQPEKEIVEKEVLPPPEEPSPTKTTSTITMRATPRQELVNAASTDHKKTSSSASSSSVATLKRRGSNDTIRTVKSSALSATSEGSSKARQPLKPQQSSLQQQLHQSPLASPKHAPAPPLGSIDNILARDMPRGATLEIGIPCIISSKRKRFKAYARYIGEVYGESGPWVGVEVPMPTGDGSWGDETQRPVDDRQWNDGSWGGIRYFEIGGAGGVGGGGSEWEYGGGGGGGEDRAARRRRIDGGSVGGAVWGLREGKGSTGLKREGDQLSIASDRMKRIRSVSPAASDVSGTESRGLFVRPQQVLYVVDAVGSDL